MKINGPVAMSSELSWLLVGPVSNSEPDVSDCIFNIVIGGNSPCDARKNEDQELVRTLKGSGRLNDMGLKMALVNTIMNFMLLLQVKVKIMNFKNVSFSGGENQIGIKPNNFDIQFTGERYEVGLPWRADLACDPVTTDCKLCRDRLKSLYVRPKGKPELLAEYNGIFREQLHTGIIEQAPVSSENVGVHVIPHHGVVLTDCETSKLRIVFDCSAKQKH